MWSINIGNIVRFDSRVLYIKYRSQNRTGSSTVRFIGVAITQVELSFETERWAACENANVNIGCKIVLVLYRM